MRVYIAGPMRGIPEFNFPAFERAAFLLRERGYAVFSPHEHDLREGFDPTGLTGHEDLAAIGFDLRAALAVDAAFICADADGVFLLPGWQDSVGARAELALAIALGLQAATEPGLGEMGFLKWRNAHEVTEERPELDAPLADWELEILHAGDMAKETHAAPPDLVNHPPHYTSDPSGVECITITRHRNFNIGNAIKYLWRTGLKGDAPDAIADLRKAVFYINDEIARLERKTL